MKLRVSAFFLALVTLGALIQPATAEAGNRGKLDRALNHVLDSGTTAAQSVIIRVQPGQLAALEAKLRAAGDVVVSEHPALNAVTALVSASHLDPLSGDGNVLTMSTNARVAGFANPNGG